MKISELVAILQKLQTKHGDIKTTIDTMTHSFPPDPAVRERGVDKVVVLNS